MLYPSRTPPPKSYRKSIVISLAIIAMIIIAVAAAPRGHGTMIALPAPGSKPMELSAFKIDVPLDAQQNSGQRFSGRFAPGQVFFVPAGATFRISGEPALEGSFADISGNWNREGGELDSMHCRAPRQPGLYHLVWQSPLAPPGCDEKFGLNVLVLTQAESAVHGEKTMLKVNGKSIGGYHDPLQAPVRRVREHAQLYRVPQFFAALTPETTGLKLGPDFELGDLVAFRDYHGPDGKKVFTTLRPTDVLALRPELIDKLIKLRQRLREKGVKVTRFWITSGFRTPDYNHSIGGASFSRHCYGDAVDLCIDEDNDKHMDDLNGDGRIDRKDGIIIGNACRELEAEGAVVPGGIGVYEWDGDDSVRCHVHIDCRGYVSRWGQIGSGKNKKSFVWWPKAEFQEDEGGE